MTPHFFDSSDISNSSTLTGKSLRKKSMLDNFRANVLERHLKVKISLAYLTYVDNEFQSFAAKNENDL